MYSELIETLRELSEDELDEAAQAANVIEKLLSERDENYADSWKVAYEVEHSNHRWVPVTERLPIICKPVLVFDGKEIYTAYYDKSRCGVGFVWRTINGYCNPRYWMPLPEPPKEGVQDER